MGTRSTYRIIEEYSTGKKVKKVKQNELCLIYFQYDGYPSGHPSETAEWLATGQVVNGFGVTEDRLVFNGAGCLAAQFIAKFKVGTGGVYIHSLDSRGQSGECYVYDIIVKDDRTIEFVAYENGYDEGEPKEFFRGSPAEFIEKFQEVEVKN